jgi:F-type H+-transporting ATPase subunit b
MLEFNATFVLVLLSFSLFAAWMKSFFFDPIARIKQARADILAQDEAQARLNDEEALFLEAQYEEALWDARRQAQARLETNQRQTQSYIAALRQKAQTEAQATLTQARARMEEEKIRLGQELSRYQGPLLQALLSKLAPWRSFNLMTSGGGRAS